jgi:energy-coupling factor transporter ATP-binding protein EcfA2
MSTRQRLESQSLPVANYSSAIAKAVEWLGDRYLLAKPINSASSGGAQRAALAVARVTAPR